MARTHKALTEWLYRMLFEKLSGGKNLHIAVLCGIVAEEALELAERIRAEFNPLELLVNMTGPVLVINPCQGALDLCGYSEDWM